MQFDILAKSTQAAPNDSNLLDAVPTVRLYMNGAFQFDPEMNIQANL